MDINPDDKTSYITQYQDTFLKDVQNEYYAKHGQVPVNTPKSVPSHNLGASAPPSRLGQSSFEPDNISSDDEEYLIPDKVAEMTPKMSYSPARRLATARLQLNSLFEAQTN